LQLARELRDDGDHRQPEMLLDVVRRPERSIEEFEPHGSADAENQPRDDAEAEIPERPRPNRHGWRGGAFHDADGVGLEASRDRSSLEALGDRVVQLLVRLGLALERQILDLLLVELLALTPHLVDGALERVFPSLRQLVFALNSTDDRLNLAVEILLHLL